jgi:hypothetical protein
MDSLEDSVGSGMALHTESIIWKEMELMREQESAPSLAARRLAASFGGQCKLDAILDSLTISY